MKGCINNKMGQIQIDTYVIALYAGTTAVECFGIVGMAAVSMKDGLVKLLKRESLTHGINVTINDNAISIDFHVIVSYGVSISTVADNLIENVKYKVEEFTGMSVEKINKAFHSCGIAKTHHSFPFIIYFKNCICIRFKHSSHKHTILHFYSILFW